jgi:hypothetical protein
MPRGSVKFKERDIRRAIRAAKKEGQGRVVLDPATGKLIVDVRPPGDGRPVTADDDLDQELASFIEAHPHEGRT